MEEHKASLIITVKNEGNSIKELLDTILSQSKVPKEIIIVDGGSTDETIEIIKEYEDILPIKLIVEKGANISKGRNVAIKNSTSSIIAVTDGGCTLDKNWFEEITKPFESNDTDAVSGAYIGTGSTLFQQVVSNLLVRDFKKVNKETFSPSSRSVAFKKKAWEEVNGYPEWLDYAEDTYFNQKLRKNGIKFQLNKKAIVYWEIRSNISKLFKQYFNYSSWDAIALNSLKHYIFRLLIWFIFISIFISSLLFKNYFMIFIGIFLVFALISIRIIYKFRNEKLKFKSYIYGLMIYCIFELALFIGYIFGLIKKMFLKKKNL